MRCILFVLGALLLCVSSVWSEEETDLQLQNRLQAHIDFLADDLMLGRQPGSKDGPEYALRQ